MLGQIRRFARDENAAVALETVLMTPILVWVYVGTFVFFDAYRVYNTSVKTAYMVLRSALQRGPDSHPVRQLLTGPPARRPGAVQPRRRAVFLIRTNPKQSGPNRRPCSTRRRPAAIYCRTRAFQLSHPGR
jgi:hypothetical protein